MTPEKVLEVIHLYQRFFRKNRIRKEKQNEKEFDILLNPQKYGLSSHITALQHCHAMLYEMEQFVKEGRMEKVFRWLGFVQGVLWLSGKFTLNELKNHNSSDDKTTA